MAGLPKSVTTCRAAIIGIAFGIAVLPLEAEASFPGRNGLIVLVGEDDSSPRIFTMRPDGSHHRQVTSGKAQGSDMSPRWSPNGKVITFSSTRTEGLGDIYSVRVDGSHMRRLTTNGEVNDWPSWTPNGRHIVFSSSRKKSRDIWIVRADGTHERRIGRYPRGDEFYPIVSPNGRWIAYSGDTNNLFRDNNSFDVWVMNRGGDKRRRLTRFDHDDFNGDEYVSDWSPDGKRILFSRWIRSSNERKHERELFSIRVDGTGLVQITDTPNHDEEGAAWSPNGRWIIYAVSTALYRIPASGGEPHVVHHAGGSDPDWQAR